MTHESRAHQGVTPRQPRMARLIHGIGAPGQYALDAACWAVAVVGGLILRYEFNVGRITWVSTFGLIVVLVLTHLAWGWPLGLFQRRYAYGSFEEVRAVGIAAVGTAALIAVPVVLYGNKVGIPRSTVLIALPMALLLMFLVRYALRLALETQLRPGESAEPTILYGAGYVGRVVVHRLLTDVNTAYRPVALIDDDPQKQRIRIRNLSVLGTLDDLPDVAQRTGATTLIVTIAKADASLIRRVDDVARRCGLDTKVVPPLDQVLGGVAGAGDVRDLSIEDLIGRQPVNTNVETIASYLTGKRVLVTGAGGSIGVELCRQIHKFAPAELIMLDRDETGLQAAQLSVAGHGLLNTPDVVLADIRDVPTLGQIFKERRPEVVFHAAALKHLPMLQQYPEEAWKTNVLGTLNVLEAARSVDVLTFVNVSTDKAADPTSVLGYSKRLAERLTAWMGTQTSRPYLSVRFGNVIGSRGSMLPLFTQMIESGGPLTVTHPEVTRYFMTIPEACQLVVQAGGIGKPGEVLILDMGEPVKILDVAKRMIEMSGKRIEIVFTGLREGEKLHEVLVTEGEQDARPIHPKISHSQVPPLAKTELDHASWLATIYPGVPRSFVAVDGRDSDGALAPVEPLPLTHRA